MKKFICKILIKFCDFLIEKFDINEKEILERLKKVKEEN